MSLYKYLEIEEQDKIKKIGANKEWVYHKEWE